MTIPLIKQLFLFTSVHRLHSILCTPFGQGLEVADESSVGGGTTVKSPHLWVRLVILRSKIYQQTFKYILHLAPQLTAWTSY